MSKLFENFARRILVSLGVKRKLNALIITITGLVATVPELAVFLPVLQSISAWLGGAALGHATIKGTVLKSGIKAISFASALQLLIAFIITSQPGLVHLVPLLQTLSVILGVFGLGVASAKK